MRIHEYAKENGKEASEIIEALGNEGRGHMSNLSEDEVESLDSFFNDCPAPMEAQPGAYINTAEPVDELADTKALLKVQEDLNHDLMKKVSDLEEEIEMLSGGSVKPIPEQNQKEINAKCATLTKKLSEEEIVSIKTNLTCLGTKSKYYEKYSILLKKR